MASRHSDKWDQLYFLKYHGDKIIDESAQMYADFFDQVPADHRLTNGDSGGGWKNVDEVFFPFRKMKISDKLFIVSHGEANGEIGNQDGGTLAADLKQWGLKQVGLITFKCCNLGRGSFLELFVSECTLHGITVGWVKGYTGAAITYRGITGDPYEFVRGDHNIPKFGDARYKIVQGNHPTPLEKFERYSYKVGEDEEEKTDETPKERKRGPIVPGVASAAKWGKSIWESRLDNKK